MTPTLAPTIRLSGGTAIPVVGLGTWPMDDAEVEAALGTAFDLGYRHVDTAENYGNETGVGRAVRASGLDRAEVFVTTKVNRRWHGVREVAQGLAGNLARLGLDYVDLLLLHWPNPDQDRFVPAWEGLIALRDRGLARAIGVSNFKPSHLQRLIDATGVVPEVNQVELHPFLTRSPVREFHAAHGIVTAAWSPLGRGNGLTEHPVVVEIAAAHARTPAQVLLRWEVQQGIVAVPKSADRRRQAENLALFDFALADDEVAALGALDTGEAHAVDSDVFGH